MKRVLLLVLAAVLAFSLSGCEKEKIAETSDAVKEWATDTATEVADWTVDTAKDAAEWATNTADTVWNWATETATIVWDWTKNTATGAWNGVTGFFDPPSTEGNPSIAPEPELPEGTQKMYLGYTVTKTGLDNGYSGEKEIGRDDPHFGMTLGKFYISGFTSAISEDNSNFIFLKTVGDNMQLHFELVQDIDMLGGDTFVSINPDNGGYDKYFGIAPTYFGRGTLIVRHTDYQNNRGEAQVYTDYLSAKKTGDANTVIDLNEEGDYEVSLDYEIKQDNYLLGTKATTTKYTNYKISFKFSVRNGNCMVFPFDAVSGEELKNTAIASNGFYLDLAYSRYLDIIVKRSLITEGANGLVEDVRFNRPASDGEKYTQEGLYTIAVRNRYTGEETVKTIYVGNDERYIAFASQGMTVDQMIRALG